MEAECCALAGTDCRPTPLRWRAGRPQLKRDPLGAPRHYRMHDPMRLVGAGLIALSACAADNVLPPAFRYPELLQTAGVQGPVRFRVRLDSLGSPQLTTFQILATPNPGFRFAVRNALTGWRDSGKAGHIIEHTVLFVMMDTAATDSVARCRSSAGEWVVCARRMRPTTLYVQ